MRLRSLGAALRLAAPALLLALAGSGIPAADAVRFTDLVNDHRRSAGCAPLQWDDRVAAVAQAHSEDMERRDYFDHTSPDGVTMQARVRLAGFVRRGPAAENIAHGQVNVDEAFRSWVESPKHRENLDFCRFTHHGLGRSGPYWTHTFLSLPAQTAPAAVRD